MSPLLVRAMRRATIYAGLLTIGLVTYFKILPALGVTGPSPADEVEATARALHTATLYGAEAGMPAFDEAQKEMQAARALLAAGQGFGARKAALAARTGAIAAQREALTRREDERRRAQQAVDEIDKLLNDLEDANKTAAAGQEKDERNRLITIMKESRQAGAALFLAFEQNNYRKVLSEEAAVKASLAASKTALEGARPKR
jgi:DNA anti-recombination protein RmuC